MENRFFTPLKELEDIIASKETEENWTINALMCLIAYGETNRTILVAEDDFGSLIQEIRIDNNSKPNGIIHRIELYTTDEISYMAMVEKGLLLGWKEMRVIDVWKSINDNEIDEILVESMKVSIRLPNPFKYDDGE